MTIVLARRLLTLGLLAQATGMALVGVAGAGVWASLLVLSRSGAIGSGAAPTAGIAIFVALTALVGFGTKAGLMPLHSWLPRAHPVAPSHISALMSGMMIKVALYGLV